MCVWVCVCVCLFQQWELTSHIKEDGGCWPAGCLDDSQNLSGNSKHSIIFSHSMMRDSLNDHLVVDRRQSQEYFRDGIAIVCGTIYYDSSSGIVTRIQHVSSTKKFHLIVAGTFGKTNMSTRPGSVTICKYCALDLNCFTLCNDSLSLMDLALWVPKLWAKSNPPQIHQCKLPQV